MVFPLNTLVWLKQAGYPWWPGIVLDPVTLEMTLPSGYDTCVLCLPSASSSVAFANSSNAEEITQFYPKTDAELLEAGRQDADCCAAIEEALDVYEQRVQLMELEEKKEEAELHVKEESESMDQGEMHMLKGHMSHNTDKHEKKRHKRREHNHSSHSERRKHPREKKSRRERPVGRNDEDSDITDELSVHSDDRKASKRRGEKNLRMGSLDAMNEYEKEARHVPNHQVDDALYLEHMLREGRQAASDTMLETIRRKLEVLTTACNHGGNISVSEEKEEELLETLSPLSTVDITLDQLRRLKIGVAVGKFLSRDYPVRVVSLASAILTYWFRQLPPATQQRLSQLSTLELASNDTTVGSERQGCSLGALGVQLEMSFTDEEVCDTIREPGIIAGAIEAELDIIDDEDVSMAILSALRDSKNTALRRALLDGSITAKELVANPNNPNAVLNKFNKTTEDTSSLEPESPLMDGSAFENYTTLYQCPGCGAREAVANEYSVQAHDNMPVYVRCLKCHETWNVEG